MKILHIITNTELGGAQRVCIDLCNCASSEGNAVAVASMAGGYLWEQLSPSVIQYQLRHMVKPVQIPSDLKVLFELRRVAKDFEPDIIHLHSSKAGVLGRIVSLPKPHRIVYTVHGFDSIRLRYRIFLPLEKILQLFSGAIVGVSQYDKNNLSAERITKNVHVVHNGIMGKETNRAGNFPIEVGSKKIVLTIARISPPKKIQLFLDVARQLPEYTFIWIGGDGSCPAERLNELYSAPNNVFLLGDIPEAGRFIPLCDLFVLFSNYEGLPMTIIEAMSQKKAIVASNVGGIYELVDERNGKLIENNVEEACEAIREILNDDAKKKMMEEESYNKFSANFTLEKMWSSYKGIYINLLKK